MVFQSTSPQGERHRPWGHYPVGGHISIHVPARGTTLAGIPGTGRNWDFNPRPRKGNDRKIRSLLFGWMRFQSTSPQGERHATATTADIRKGFQSTSPQGERHSQTSIVADQQRFQSTSPQGERLCAGRADSNGGIFQSTSPQGERPS